MIVMCVGLSRQSTHRMPVAVPVLCLVLMLVDRMYWGLLYCLQVDNWVISVSFASDDWCA